MITGISVLFSRNLYFMNDLIFGKTVLLTILFVGVIISIETTRQTHF